tara:strand:- start:1811 stop:2203 length:393 start_codon:yes stop_codon:yes gene_type:complete
MYFKSKDFLMNQAMLNHFTSLVGIESEFEGFCSKEKAFKYSGIVWKIIEDEYDGFRSQLDWVVYGNQNISFNNNNNRVATLERWDGTSTKSISYFTGWVLKDVETDSILLMIGTDFSDHYYPSTILEEYR